MVINQQAQSFDEITVLGRNRKNMNIKLLMSPEKLLSRDAESLINKLSGNILLIVIC